MSDNFRDQIFRRHILQKKFPEHDFFSLFVFNQKPIEYRDLQKSLHYFRQTPYKIFYFSLALYCAAISREHVGI